MKLYLDRRIYQTMLILSLILGCHDKQNDGTLAGISPPKTPGQLPLSVSCQLRTTLSTMFSGVKDGNVLSVDRQFDGSYTAFIHTSINPNKNGALWEAIPNISFQIMSEDIPLYGSPTRHEKYLRFFKNQILKKFDLNAYNNGEGSSFLSTVSLSYCQILPVVLSCYYNKPLTQSRVKVGSTLMVVGSVYDSKRKIYYEVNHSVIVDLLTKNSAGQDVIFSLTNQIPVDMMPINAQVLNKNRELVGFVKSYNPSKQILPFALEIINIHDQATRSKLEQEVVLKQPRIPPIASEPSARLQAAICDASGYQKNIVSPVISTIIANNCANTTRRAGAQ